DIPSASSILIRSCVGIGIVNPFLLKSCDDDSRNVTGRRADAALFSQRAHPAQNEPLTWLNFIARPAHLNLNTHSRRPCHAACGGFRYRWCSFGASCVVVGTANVACGAAVVFR